MTGSTSHSRLQKTLAVSALALAQCFIASGSQAAGSAVIPSPVQAAGVLNIATYAGFPPLEFMKDGKYVGAEIELGEAIAQRLGVRAVFANVPFEGLIPGLLSGRFDIALSDISDTESRRKQVDFVDYAQAFTSIIVQKGNPKGIRTLGDLCGLPVATQLSSMQSRLLEQQSEACVASGKPAVAISRFPSQAQVGLELSSGRSVAEVRDFALGVYEANQSEGKLEVVEVDGKPAMVGSPGKVGIAIKKNNAEMARALMAALVSLKQDGTYDRIFEKWGVANEAIAEFSINDGNH